MLVSLVAFGCENLESEKVNLDEYYVKYEVRGSSIYSYSKLLQVTIKDESNSKTTFETGKVFEVIIGPVKKGQSTFP